MIESRLPVTLLTGFLGAGKSTLLNKILANDGAGKIALIVNEFGEVGLDHDLIETTDEEVVLLASGCICCSIRGDLTQTMAELLNRREAGDLDFDRVVIETTGLADPAPIQQTLLVDHFLATNVFLDGIVTVADTVNGPKTLDAHFESVSQVATADVLLLSKTDLASESDVQSYTARLRGINTSAPVHTVAEAVKNPKLMFEYSGLRRDTNAKTALSWLAAPKPAATPVSNPLDNLSGFAPAKPVRTLSVHDGRINSASVTLEAPLKDNLFDYWLDNLVATHGKNLLRVKGIVFLERIEKPFVFHGVQHIFEPPVQLKDWPMGDYTSRIVVIARDMTAAELEDSLSVLRENQSPPPSPPVFAGWDDVEGKNWP